MKKKALALILAGMMLTLAACGGNSGASGNSSGGASAPQTETTAPGTAAPGTTDPNAAEPGTAGEPGSGTPTDVEEAGEGGPTVEQPGGTAEGPTATDTTVDPGAVPGGGSSSSEEEEAADVWAIEGAGVLFTAPEEFSQLKGMLLERGGGETVEGSGVTFYSVSYLGMTPEEYSAFMENASAQPSDEEIDKFRKAYRDLFTIYSIDGNRTEEDLRTYLEEAGLTDVNLEQLDVVDEYTFFFSDEASSDKLEELGEFEEEYKALAAMMETYKTSISCVEPVPAE